MRALAISVALLCGCAGSISQSASSHPQSLQASIARTMLEARDAIDRYGETAEAMHAIQESLRKLATEPGLDEFDELEALHGGSAMAAMPLATEGDSGITLFIVRFAANNSTRVHDHLAWGVIHVLHGRDNYIAWRQSNETEAVEKRAITLEPGESTYWLSPPNDIHSQESLDADVWELIVAGKNLMSPIVTDHRHYYEPAASKAGEAVARQHSS
jgi:predicted metal-dependent enzyme (double-stranded beta helix superfamily)